MTTHINQSIKLFKKYSALIDRCRTLGEGKNPKKIISTGILTLNLKNREFEMEVELAQYAEVQHTLDTQSNQAAEENKETALWSPIVSHNVPMRAH